MTDYISRADAIEAVRKCVVESELLADWNKAMESAQELLSALPSAEAPKGDLISRQWLLEVYGDYIGDNGESKYNVPLEVVRQSIKDAPSAEAVQGEWIEEDEYGDLWVCDQCGFANEYKINFCPNCGARMKGGDEE